MEKERVDSELEVNVIERKGPEETESKHRWRGWVAFLFLQRKEHSPILRVT